MTLSNTVGCDSNVNQSSVEKQIIRPILKWAGGKGQLLSQFKEYLPSPTEYNAYHEPFFGGGALFFSIQPKKAYLSDLNKELIEVYEVVRDNVEELIVSLQKHKNEESYYYYIRDKDPMEMDKIERASRFIFLNKTCYNGLYRVNRNGKFNVPFGRYKNPDFVNEKGLRAANEVLQGVDLKIGDFSQVLKRAKRGDFIYLDPPYHPVTTTANFTDYTAIPFGESEQIRLSEVFRKLHKKGCKVMLSNSDTPLINELYKDFTIKKVRAKRSINCRADRRGPVNEVVVLSWV